MNPLLLVLAAGGALLIAFLTYGRWLARRIFDTEGPEADARTTPAHALKDNVDFVPTKRSVLFGHHFTSIAGTGPIVGPAIAVMWGWLPAILWVVFGSIFIGAVHDLGSLVVSLRNKGRSIGDVAGDLLGPRVRLIFLCILIVGLWIVLAIFGLVIAGVQRTYPASITPVLIQIPLAIAIGLLIHRGGRSIFWPSAIALALMYASVIWGDVGVLHDVNMFLAAQPVWIWTAGLLIYCYIASVLPVWVLLQPRDYINALQLVSCLALITTGLIVAATIGGAPDAPSSVIHPLELSQVNGSTEIVEIIAPDTTPEQLTRSNLQFVAPMIDWQPTGAPPMFPLLFITIACGAVSGFHCLVASGTSSKQVNTKRVARPVAYGAMLTEGFLAVLVIAACAAGIGLGLHREWSTTHDGTRKHVLSLETGLEERSRFREFVLSDGPEPITIQNWYSMNWRSDRGSNRHLVVDSDGYFWCTDSLAIAMLANQLDIECHESLRSGNRGQGFPTSTARITLPIADGTIQMNCSNDLLLRNGAAFCHIYSSWSSSSSLANTVGAFVEGAANFLHALGIPLNIGIAFMAVMVVAFAATTLDTACRLQRYVIQEFASTFLPKRKGASCPSCGYDLSNTAPMNDCYVCPECGRTSSRSAVMTPTRVHRQQAASSANPFKWLGITPIATLVAVVPAFLLLITPSNLTWPKAPAGAFVTFSAGVQQLLANVGSNGTGMWMLFGTISHLLAGFAFIVIAAWLIAMRKPIWFLVPPAVLMLGFSAWAIIWRAFIGTAEIPSWYSDSNWTFVMIAIMTFTLEIWVVGEFAWKLIQRSWDMNQTASH